MSWLDALFGRVFNNAVEIPLVGGVNFTGGLSAGKNPVTQVVDVVVSDGGVGAAEAARVEGNAAIGVVLSLPFDGSSQDVPLFTAAPYDFRIVMAWARVSTAVGSSSVRWRSAAGGGGSTLTAPIFTDTTGTYLESGTLSVAVGENTGCHLRLSATGIAGVAYLLVQKI
jgi:hypothetical protein